MASRPGQLPSQSRGSRPWLTVCAPSGLTSSTPRPYGWSSRGRCPRRLTPSSTLSTTMCRGGRVVLGRHQCAVRRRRGRAGHPADGWRPLSRDGDRGEAGGGVRVPGRRHQRAGRAGDGRGVAVEPCRGGTRVQWTFAADGSAVFRGRAGGSARVGTGIQRSCDRFGPPVGRIGVPREYVVRSCVVAGRTHAAEPPHRCGPEPLNDRAPARPVRHVSVAIPPLPTAR